MLFRRPKKHFEAVIAAVLFAAGPLTARGQTLTNLYNFGGAPNDGKNSRAALFQDANSNLYGTTYAGGSNNIGVVFRVTPAGILTNLHHFAGPEGSHPVAEVVPGNDGNFYGTTYLGGTNAAGVVYVISPQGAFTNLWSFNGSNGNNPAAALLPGTNGWFYGTTQAGASNGNIFAVSPAGSFSNLWSFSITNGLYPFTSLTLGTNGNFYGTTLEGGISNAGTIFMISPQGSFSNLAQFTATNGAGPLGRLALGSGGNFYGTTYAGTGASTNGSFFRMTPQGALTNLWQFGGPEGAHPGGNLTVGSDGNFYGITVFGGASNLGAIYRITPQGALTSLYQFSGSDGQQPVAGMIQGFDGNLYGTTEFGGAHNAGTIFELIISSNAVTNQIRSIRIASNTNLVFTVFGAAGKTYQLEFTPSLAPPNWTNIPSVSAAPNYSGLFNLTNFGAVSNRMGFYRLLITP